MSRAIERHYRAVAALGCCVTRNEVVVIHHCFGGSMTPKYGLKSMSDRGISDWLVIPLWPPLHTGTNHAIHSLGAKRWEKKYGTQMEYLEWVNEQLDYDIYERYRDSIKKI
jgi:hypothetical protein